MYRAIRYRYKSPLLFLHGSGQNGAFTQKDYLAQILKVHLQPILKAFAAKTHQLHPTANPLFIEDGNSAHGHKSITNCCQRWRTEHGIVPMPHPSMSLIWTLLRSAGGESSKHCTDENTNRLQKLKWRQQWQRHGKQFYRNGLMN
jgi:hypothetical protein